MFRNSSKSQPGPIAISSMAPQQASTTWRPTLRKIKKGLFSTKDDAVSEDIQSHSTVSSRQQANAYLSRTTSVRSTGSAKRKVSTFSRSRTTRERPRDSQDQPSSKSFTFIRPSASSSRSRSKRHRPTESQGGLLDGSVDLDQQGPYVPRHAASDFSKSTQQKPSTQQPSATPYKPTHAASDFSKLKLAPKTPDTKTSPPRITPPKSLDPSIRPLTSPAKIEDENNDYQMFLAAARAAAARNYNTTGVISPNKPKPGPQVSQKMKEIVAKHHENGRP